jgi:hypothetical protein
MKKLIACLSIAFLYCVSAFAAEWQSAIYDNIVNDICVTGDKIYTATNGGVEVFSKDGRNLPGESTSWKIYTTVSNSGFATLPRNFVKSLAVDTNGDIFAMGNGWFGCGINSSYWDIPVQNAEDVAIGPDGVKWAIMSINNRHGLYRLKSIGWEYITMPAQVPLADFSIGTCRIAVGDYGKDKDSIFCTLWGTCPTGIFRYDAITATVKVWPIGKMVAGSPLDIAVWEDKVIAAGESGTYIFTADTEASPWVLAYPPEMPHNNGGSVAYFKGHFYLGQRDGGLWMFDAGWKNKVPANNQAYGGSINCLATDGNKLYIGTNNKMWVYDEPGSIVPQLAVTAVHYPHDNNITHINRDNTGRILVGTSSGGYRYDNTDISPMLNSSSQNISDDIVTSLVDIYGNEWVGKGGYINMNDKPVYLPNLEYGLYPYWLIRGTANSTTDVWMVTTNPTNLRFYAGGSSWFIPPDAPAQLVKEKVLSVNSTGKRVWIGTDSSLYSYDFHGNWTYKRMQYSTVRFVAGDPNVDGGVWVADGGYADGAYDIEYHNVNYAGNVQYSWPYHNRKPNAVYLDHHGRVWACTDSGVYYKDPINLWQAVPLVSGSNRNLADNHVNTIYVDSTNAVWFGTAGGLTVWHRSASTSVRPASSPAMKIPALQKLSAQSVIYDVGGRKILNGKIPARGVFIEVINGKTIKHMNINRQYR